MKKFNGNENKKNNPAVDLMLRYMSLKKDIVNKINTLKEELKNQ